MKKNNPNSMVSFVGKCMEDKPNLKSLLKKTLFLCFFGFFLYLGLLPFDFPVQKPDVLLDIVLSPWGVVLGIILLSLAIAMLLVADEVQQKKCILSEPESGGKNGGNNGHPTSYRFLTFCAQRKALVALTFLLIFSGIWVIVSIISSLFTIEFSDSSGIGIRLGGQTVGFYPISPYEEWQNTRIRLKKDELFQVEIFGRVSPGHVRSLEEIRKYIENIEKWGNMPKPEILWRFTGPEGYKDEFYEKARKGEIPELWRLPHYTKDKGLTVKGLPHNKVVGIVLPEGDKPEKQYDWKTGCPLKKPKPNSSFQNPDSNEEETDCSPRKPGLILLSPDSKEKGYPITRRTPDSGVLWVVINDSKDFRMDNAGQFFMKVLVR
ncbi:hypothetical protein [Candidatus Thiosymbion oneisti]|uniref:hypothetical protein n=1 Tax=Candidatus Thiosymbion oneisti TaxID=589554 RepID=UPI000B7CF634|nr:hypothetical protein [Candidatus Thiosymbion oneisti]